MKNMIIDSIGNIDNDMVESVAALRQKKNGMPAWLKWSAMAACLCLVVAGTLTVIQFNKYSTMTGSGTMAGDPIKTVGEGNPNQDESSNMPGASHTANAGEEQGSLLFEKDCSNSDELNDYNAIETLLNDSYALVKVKVVGAHCASVRSYIYTSYSVEVIDILYGKMDENVITVNMPGGIVEDEDAHTMISEIADGKDAGDLTNTGVIISGGNADWLLEAGDEAYLFVMPEADDAYAVVGEYHGAILVRNGNVIFNKDIVGFKEDEAAMKSGEMPETEFRKMISEMVNGIK